MNLERDKGRKDKTIKNLLKKPIWNDSKDWQTREFSRPTRAIFTTYLPFSTWNSKKNNANWGDLVLKKINKKLDVNLQKTRLKGLTELVGKRMDRPTTVNLTKYNTRQIKLKGTAVSITESLKAKGMKQLKKAREEHGFTNVWTADGRILFKVPNVNKSNLYHY